MRFTMARHLNGTIDGTPCTHHILTLTHALGWSTLVIQVCTCIPVVSAVGCYLINPLASLHSAQVFSHINWDQQVSLVGAVRVSRVLSKPLPKTTLLCPTDHICKGKQKHVFELILSVL